MQRGCLHAVKQRLTALERSGTLPEIDTIQNIARHVCAAHGIDPASIYPQGKRNPHVVARQIVMQIALRFGFGASQIARHFGRDHSTVLHADFVTNERIKTSPEFAAKYAAIYAEVQNERA